MIIIMYVRNLSSIGPCPEPIETGQHCLFHALNIAHCHSSFLFDITDDILAHRRI
jgi:hypothetical protein